MDACENEHPPCRVCMLPEHLSGVDWNLFSCTGPACHRAVMTSGLKPVRARSSDSSVLGGILCCPQPPP